MGRRRQDSLVDKRPYGSEEWDQESERKASLDLERARKREFVSLDSGREMERSEGERVAWEEHLYDPELETEGELEISGLTSFMEDEEAEEVAEGKMPLSHEEKSSAAGLSSFFKLGGLSSSMSVRMSWLSTWEPRTDSVWSASRVWTRFPASFASQSSSTTTSSPTWSQF